MVDMLQPIAAGWVKTIAPTRYLRSWKPSSHADEASAAELGRWMGAGS
jgi:hypothetical protein